MTLYLIGLGLWDETDISLKGLELVKKCDLVYLENYTSVMLGTTQEKLEKLFNKNVISLDREEVEQKREYLEAAKTKNVALLIGGDPTVATTHTEIILEAKKSGIETKIIHSSSIYTAITEAGLFIYKFGKSCSIPFPQEGFKPESFYDVIVQNLNKDTHTTVFLDLKPEENKFMTINEGLRTLLDIGKKDNKINEDTLAVGFARMGSKDQLIKAGKIKELLNYDFGRPMHVIVIPGKLHFVEEEALNSF